MSIENHSSVILETNGLSSHDPANEHNWKTLCSLNSTEWKSVCELDLTGRTVLKFVHGYSRYSVQPYCQSCVDLDYKYQEVSKLWKAHLDDLVAEGIVGRSTYAFTYIDLITRKTPSKGQA